MHSRCNDVIRGSSARCYFSSRRNGFFFKTFSQKKIVFFLEKSKIDYTEYQNDKEEEMITVPTRLHNIMLCNKRRLGRELMHSDNRKLFENIFGCIQPKIRTSHCSMAANPILKLPYLHPPSVDKFNGYENVKSKNVYFKGKAKDILRTEDTHIKNCLIVQRRLGGKVYDFKNMEPDEVKRVKEELKIIRKKERKIYLRKK